jgi:RNA-directed DNA polymerase
VSSKVFSALDHYLWRLLYRWACHRHPKKSKHWVVARYFGKYNKGRDDTWVFGDRKSGAYLHKFAWTPVTRHTLVKGAASPDDPSLTRYWADRRRKQKPPPLAPSLTRQIKKQRGRCTRCGDYLLFADHEPQSPSQWEAWFTAIRTAIAKTAIATQSQGRPGIDDHHLVHAYCLPTPEDSDDPGGTTTDSTACTPSRPA